MMESNNDIVITIVSATLVLLIFLVFLISFLFIYKNRQIRHRAEMVSVKEKYDQEILKAQLEIKEQTLKNISEEIHDNVGQVLSLAVLNLSAIELNDIERAAIKIENVTRLVENAVSDLRNLSKTLDADNIITAGLIPLLRFELELLEKTGIYKTSFEITGQEQRLTDSREIVVYRIVQESLNNIIKHSRATVIRLRIDFSDAGLSIQIIDKGIGFDAEKIEEQSIHKQGAGLKNMRRRAGLIGAFFSIKSVPLKGTTISIVIPLAPGANK